MSTRLNKILWALDLEGEDLILQEQGEGWVTVATWDGVDDGTFTLDTGGEFTSLLDAIITQFNATATNTYEFQQVTSDPFGRDDFRLKLVRTAGAASFRLTTTQSGTAPNMLTRLGAASETGPVTESGGEIEFPNSYDGCWVLPKGYQYLDERERPGQDVKVMVTNDDRVFTASKNTRRRRFFHFLAVDGSLVFKDAVEYSWRRGNLNATELNASFEHFWDSCIRVGKKFVVVHDIPAGTETLDDSGYGYYVCRVTDVEPIRDMMAMVTDRLGDFGSEVYDLRFTAKELSITQPS